MPKSKRGKGKYYRQVKKTPTQQPPGTVEATSAAAATLPKPAAAPKPAAPIPSAPAAAKATTASAALKTGQYAYFTGDLARIGVVTGIVAVILIILFVFLH